jgi:hypothetical protein
MDSDGAVSSRLNNFIQFIHLSDRSNLEIHGNQFQLKSLNFGLKRSDKKAKSFEMIAKALVKMLEGESLSNVEEGEIEKINKEEEELKRLEKEEDNKFPCCFESFLRHKCLLAIATVISIALMAIILMSF